MTDKLKVIEGGSKAAPGKERILMTAMELFAERGYDAVTVRDITAAADVSPALINHHFGSKAGLRDAVDEFFIERFEAFYGDDQDHVEDLEPKEFMSTVESWVSNISDDWPVITRYFRRALLEETEWGEKLFRRYFGIVRGSIDRLDAQGLIRPDVDRLWLPFLFIYLETGTMLMDPYIEKVLGRSGFEPDLWKRRYHAYSRMIAQGVMTQPREDDKDE